MLVELVVAVSDAAEFADALLDAGALAVTIEDANADTGDEEPLYGEPGTGAAAEAWPVSRLRILVDDQQAQSMLLHASATRSMSMPSIESLRPVENADWVRASQAEFEPIPISERLWIVPSWHQPPGDVIAIRLDPGAAFGTGAHATTRLCLQWLDRELRRGDSVLDYGTGSGILAIAAAKLGASRVVGVDVDLQALATARANSGENAVDASYTEPDELASGTFDVVVANILANPLSLLAPALLARVAPGGALVLSGVLERQADLLIATYAAADAEVRLQVADAAEGWVCLAGRRHAA